MVFLAYHNRDLSYAFRVANLLIRNYRRVWLDRYSVSPLEDWNEAIRQGHDQATAAIVIVSDDFLDSDYCRTEYARLRERGIPITALIARDFSTENIADFVFNDWIDFRRWFDEPNDLSVENLLSQVPQSEAAMPIGDRTEYLQSFVESAELSLAQLPTALSSHHQQPGQELRAFRPRGYCTQPLQNWEFRCRTDQGDYPVENLHLWASRAGSFALSGEAGSGKTVFARLLALAYAHRAMRQSDAALPIWLDLMIWDERFASLDDFIESEWGLVSYWKHWLEQNRAIFFLDNLSDLSAAHQEFAGELQQWMRANVQHQFVVLAAAFTEGRVALPVLEIPTVSEGLALKFAGFALNINQLNDFRQILRQHHTQIENRHLDYLAIGLELLVADKSLAYNHWQGNPLPALLKARQQHAQQKGQGHSDSELLAFLQDLAWSMMQLEHHRRVKRTEVEILPASRNQLESAIGLGLLCQVGNYLRFQSEVHQRYLAADQLSVDGVEKYLTRPQFSAAGYRSAQKWDELVLILADNASEESRRRLLKKLLDIDPYLAWMCLQRHTKSLPEFQEQLLHSLIELAANNPAGQSAFHAVVQTMPDLPKTAEALVGQLNRYDNRVQLWIWRELLALPLDLPVSFVQAVATIDRAGALPAIEQFDDYPLALLLSYLVKLTTNADRRIRTNAIWLVGELKYLPCAVLLLDYLEDANRDDHEEILLALIGFAYSEILARLLRWARDNPTQLELVILAMEKRGRWVSSRLLRLANDEQLLPNAELYDLLADHNELDIAVGLAQITERHVELTESIKRVISSHKKAALLGEMMTKAVKSWPNRQHFELMRADIQKVLESPPESTVIAGSNLGVLLYGQQAFDGLSAQAERERHSSLTADLREQLQSADWQQRYRAIPGLQEYSAEVALPYLLDLTADRETIVRLAAYESLTGYSDQPPAHKALIAALSDADVEIVNAAAELLKALPGFDYDELLDLLDSANPTAVLAVIDTLEAVRYQPALNHLRNLLEDDRRPRGDMPSIGQRAAAAIATIEALQATEGPAVDPMPADSSESAGAFAPAEPGGQSFTDADKVAATLQLLRDDDWGRTQKAAKFLRKFAKHLRHSDNARILDALCEALRDDNWHVRWAVAEALAWLQNADAIPHLTSLLQDANWIVQVAAVRALVQLSSDNSARQMLPLLQNPQKAVREAVAEALGELGNSVAIGALEQTAQSDSDAFVRLAALKSLHDIDPAAAYKYLEVALADEFIHLRWFAMQALAPQLSAVDVPLLTSLLADDDKPSWEDESIRDLAVAALRRINTQDSLAALEALRQPEDQTHP